MLLDEMANRGLSDETRMMKDERGRMTARLRLTQPSLTFH